MESDPADLDPGGWVELGRVRAVGLFHVPPGDDGSRANPLLQEIAGEREASSLRHELLDGESELVLDARRRGLSRAAAIRDGLLLEILEPGEDALLHLRRQVALRLGDDQFRVDVLPETTGHETSDLESRLRFGQFGDDPEDAVLERHEELVGEHGPAVDLTDETVDRVPDADRKLLAKVDLDLVDAVGADHSAGRLGHDAVGPAGRDRDGRGGRHRIHLGRIHARRGAVHEFARHQGLGRGLGDLEIPGRTAAPDERARGGQCRQTQAARGESAEPERGLATTVGSWGRGGHGDIVLPRRCPGLAGDVQCRTVQGRPVRRPIEDRAWNQVLR